jgi:hypothetical protein
MKHGGRAHSKFSASGSERWTQCSASVEASEGQPDKTSVWAEEGTKAHELLEEMMLKLLSPNTAGAFVSAPRSEMYTHARDAAHFMLKKGAELNAEVLVETRVYLDFIHPEMFGTFDGAVLDHFGTLHVFDFKYGAGHAVSAKENLQMIFYGLGLAAKYQWNFQTVRLWIIQPRIKGYDGPTFWDITIDELKAYVKVFRDAVWRVENKPEYKEGSWCYFCRAKSICPLKREAKFEKAIEIFKTNPIGGNDGKEKIKIVSQGEIEIQEESLVKEKGLKSEAEWRKKAREGRSKKGVGNFY